MKDHALDEQELLLKNAADQIWYLKDPRTYGKVNRAHADFLGKEKSEIENKDLYEITSTAEEAEVCIQGNKEVFEKKETVQTEEWVVNGEEEERLLSITKTPKIDDDGEVKYVVCSARDITERKKRERELQTYADVFDNVPVGLHIYRLERLNDDSSLRMIYANKITETYTSIPVEEVVGKTLDESFPGLREKGVPQAYAEVARTGKAKELGDLYYGDEKVPGKWFNVRAFPLPDNCVGASFTDITERKGAEEELKKARDDYRTITNLTGDIIVQVDTEARWTFLNDGACEFWGKPREELIGSAFGDYLHPDDQEKTMDAVENMMKSGETVKGLVNRQKTPEGWRTVQWNGAPIFEDGKYIGFQATGRDITERVRAERALEGERDKLRNLHDAVDKLQQQETEEDVLGTAVDVAETMLDFEICAIDTLEGDYLVPKATSADLDPEETTTFKIGEGIVGKTLQKGETIWGEDVREHPDAKPTKKEWGAFISVPIGEIGVLQVVSKEVASFQEQDVELAEILAGHLREELKRVRLEEELRQQAIRDPLTGLFNRRHFNQSIEKEIERADRYNHPLGFLMLDINRFKEINDRYSHLTGDKVLREVADLLHRNVRDADTVIRYGGDEFLIILPETDGETEEIKDRIREKLDKWNQKKDLIDFPLTLGIGSSYWDPESDREVEEVLKEADRKMYEDKISR